jgi:hypothetical protein
MLSWQQYAEAAGIFAAAILLRLWSDRRWVSRIYHDDPDLQAVVDQAKALNAVTRSLLLDSWKTISPRGPHRFRARWKG